MRIFFELFLYFITFSILGWIMEVFLKYLQFHRFINRGFLIGPYCPIYGYGVLFITIIIEGLLKLDNNIILSFLCGMILCGAIEYITSWFMEKMFHARWWDYSQKPLNINGRVWIGNLLLFGLAAVLIIYLVNPFYFKLIKNINNTILYTIGIILLIIYISDNIISYFVMNIVKNEIDNTTQDNTESIAKEVRMLLSNKNLLIKRINNAYPNFKARPKRILLEIKKAKEQYKIKIKEFKKLKKQYIKKQEQKLINEINIAKANVEKAHNKYIEIKEKLFSKIK